MKTFCKKKHGFLYWRGRQRMYTANKYLTSLETKTRIGNQPRRQFCTCTAVTWILVRYYFSLISSPPVPTLNFVVEMGGRKLHPPLCIQSMLKIAGLLLKGLCILETSEKKLRGSFLIVHENIFFASWLRKWCPELPSCHLNKRSSLVKWQNWDKGICTLS